MKIQEWEKLDGDFIVGERVCITEEFWDKAQLKMLKKERYRYPYNNSLEELVNEEFEQAKIVFEGKVIETYEYKHNKTRVIEIELDSGEKTITIAIGTYYRHIGDDE